MLGGTRDARTGRAGFPFGTGSSNTHERMKTYLPGVSTLKGVNLRKRAQAN
jgi:hypothetical protein